MDVNVHSRLPRDAFAHAIQTWEGMYQADPKDAGNIRRGSVVVGTMRGVTPKTWAVFKGIPVESITAQQMQAISLEDAVDVYEALFYQGPGFDRLVWCAATEVLCDIGWGSGTATAIKMLQRMIGEHPDGVIGPRTIEAYNAWVSDGEMAGHVHSIAEVRSQFYRDIVVKRPANQKFLVGWLRRANWYRPTNAIWWAAWQGEKLSPTVERGESSQKPVPVTPQDDATKEVGVQRYVQVGTGVGAAATGLASFFKVVPPWAIGVAIVAIVLIGTVWALKSLGVIKRAL